MFNRLALFTLFVCIGIASAIIRVPLKPVARTRSRLNMASATNHVMKKFGIKTGEFYNEGLNDFSNVSVESYLNTI